MNGYYTTRQSKWYNKHNKVPFLVRIRYQSNIDMRYFKDIEDYIEFEVYCDSYIRPLVGKVGNVIGFAPNGLLIQLENTYGAATIIPYFFLETSAIPNYYKETKTTKQENNKQEPTKDTKNITTKSEAYIPQELFRDLLSSHLRKIEDSLVNPFADLLDNSIQPLLAATYASSFFSSAPSASIVNKSVRCCKETIKNQH